ncbi:TetR family transcriptional regulator [Streptomyces sp. NPDC002580]|uniref:TetR family transcriptional regulator n=1 Tax=Streptomyces sp. NPDC002580 TaxID=3364653 RepID=UPI00367B2E08
MPDDLPDLDTARPDPPRVAWRRQMRERVLAAAEELTSAHGWDRVRVVDLADRAEVSRPSIYKEFGDRAGIGRVLVQRETDRVLSGVARALEQPGQDVGACLRAAVSHTLSEGADNPLVSAVLHAAHKDTDALLPYLASRPDPIFDSARALLEAWFARRAPETTSQRRAGAADVAVRLTLSHMLLPSSNRDHVPQQVVQAVLAVLGPVAG